MKIVIVEDHLMFRDVVQKACTTDLGHVVVGESSSGAGVAELVARLQPHVLILDLSLPDLDGFSVAEEVRRLAPATRILVLSCHTDHYAVFRLERIGIHGFIDKNTQTVKALKPALDALEQGRTFFCDSFKARQSELKLDPHSFSKILSNSEHAILILISYGLDDDEIGVRLKISARTASTHRSNILKKLSVKGTPKLIRFAIDHGFTVQSPPLRKEGAA